MIGSIRATIFLCLLPCVISFSAQAKLSPEQEWAITTILNPKSDRRDVRHALEELQEFKSDQIETPDGRRVVISLVRRCRLLETTDLDTAARALLSHLVGKSQMARLIEDSETRDKN